VRLTEQLVIDGECFVGGKFVVPCWMVIRFIAEILDEILQKRGFS